MRHAFGIPHLPNAALQRAQDAVQRTRCAIPWTPDAVQGALRAMLLTKDAKSPLMGDFLH